MKGLNTIFMLAAILLVTTGGVNSKKMIVTYLGTDFILPGGCPPPKCDSTLRDCRKEHIEREKKFNQCMYVNNNHSF